MVSCDYRFLRNGDRKEIWLRDTSSPYQNSDGEIEGVISAYTNISDIRATLPKRQKKSGSEDVVAIMKGLVHEIQNALHVMTIGLDLMNQPHDGHAVIYDGIERVKKSMRDLTEYLSPPYAKFSAHNLGTLLEQLGQQAKKKLEHRRIRLRMVHQSALPMVRVDPEQLHSALERILEFSSALLPDGGEVDLEAGLEKIDGQSYVKLEIISSSGGSLEVEEEEVFRPFLRVNNQQVGLSLSLARQILHRHKGNIFFRKESPNRAFFTILLRAHPV